MSRPLPLELPILQNWSCHTCGGCCKQHGIYITAEEQKRIEKQGWTAADGIPDGQPLFVSMGGLGTKRWTRLAHQPDGSCVFLDERGLCKIHGKFGEPAKPLACRVYPYAFHPAGDQITVSLRFSCPSVAENLGTPIIEQTDELNRLAKLVVPDAARNAPAPKLTDQQSLDWPDALLVVDALDTLLAQEELGLIDKLQQAVQFAGLLESARLEEIRGQRMEAFLQVLLHAIASEDRNEAAPPPPGRLAATQFRLLAGHYARKDTYSTKISWTARSVMLWAGWKFARGAGMTPAVQEVLKPVPFAALERPLGSLPEQVDEMLTRYLRVKVQGLHFCGAAYYREPMIRGFQSLALVIPVVLWLARWLASSNGRDAVSTADVVQAITIADHHHGYSPALGMWTFRNRVRTLAQMGQIERLVRWYGR